MKSLIKKLTTFCCTSMVALTTMSASATVTLDNVTDYYLYATLIETEFDIDNRVVEQISDISGNAILDESFEMLVHADVSDEQTQELATE